MAFELELSTKEVVRRERILAGYAADRRIDAVVYLVEHRSVGRAIERSAARMGISHLVRVQRVSMAPSAAKQSGRMALVRGRAAQRTGAGGPAEREQAR